MNFKILSIIFSSLFVGQVNAGEVKKLNPGDRYLYSEQITMAPAEYCRYNGDIRYRRNNKAKKLICHLVMNEAAVGVSRTPLETDGDNVIGSFNTHKFNCHVDYEFRATTEGYTLEITASTHKRCRHLDVRRFVVPAFQKEAGKTLKMTYMEFAD